MKKNKSKKVFVLSMIQAGIYSALALIMAIVCIYVVAKMPHSFTSYLVNEYGSGSKVSVSYSVRYRVEASSALEEYYEDFNVLGTESYVVAQSKPYLLVIVKYETEGNVSFEDEVIFNFNGNNKSEEYLSFKHPESGEIIDVTYNEMVSYNYENEIFIGTFFGILMGGLCGAMIIFAVLQFLIAFRCKTSIRANNCGIALNVFTFMAIVGIPGFAGAIIGRKYLRLKARGLIEDEEDTHQASSVTENKIIDISANSDSAESGTAGVSPSSDTGSGEYEKIEKVELEDVSIHEKEWKEFRKTASQDELFILGIGSKYRLRTGFVKSVIFAIGIVLSIVIGLALMAVDISAALIILIAGYLVFSFLSSKHIRYQDTYNQIKRKLQGEYKESLKKVLNYPTWMSIVDGFLQFALMWLTIPYQALMLAIGMIAPDFVISKNGVLVSVPKGYGLDNLIAMGEYYKRASLLDELTDRSQKKQYTFTNDYGTQQTVYSSDGKNFYDAAGAYVASSNDGGKTLEFPNNRSTDEDDDE